MSVDQEDQHWRENKVNSEQITLFLLHFGKLYVPKILLVFQSCQPQSGAIQVSPGCARLRQPGSSPTNCFGTLTTIPAKVLYIEPSYIMKNEFLRHTLSTIKYRFDKSVKGSTEDFGGFSLGKGSRSPKEIIHHMYDVIYSTRVFIEQETRQKEPMEKLTFNQEVDRFNSELTHIDKVLDRTELDINYSKKLLQGPFSDLLTNVGQITMLQRLNENAIEGEDFSRSKIETGLK